MSGDPTSAPTLVQRALERRQWVLIPSYQLGPQCWTGVEEFLSVLGQTSVSPMPVRTTPRDDDHLGPWLEGIVADVGSVGEHPLVIVGHAASCPRLPMVADRLLAEGHDVDVVIAVNGRFPEDGVAPTERHLPLTTTLDALVRPDDYLPPWHRWWGTMVADMLPDDAARERVFAESKPVPRAVFDQPIPAPKLPGEVGLAYLGLGAMYLQSHEVAADAGWVVDELVGEHLHMVVAPVMVGGALLSLVGRATRRG